MVNSAKWDKIKYPFFNNATSSIWCQIKDYNFVDENITSFDNFLYNDIPNVISLVVVRVIDKNSWPMPALLFEETGEFIFGERLS